MLNLFLMFFLLNLKFFSSTVMVQPPPEPSKAEIDQLRSTVLQKLQDEEGLLDTLVPKDVNRFKTDDSWLRRFLMHHDNDQKLSSEMAVSTLKWRKDMDVNSNYEYVFASKNSYLSK